MWRLVGIGCIVAVAGIIVLYVLFAETGPHEHKDDARVLSDAAIKKAIVDYDRGDAEDKVRSLREIVDCLFYVSSEVVPRVELASRSEEEQVRDLGNAAIAALVFGDLIGKLKHASCSVVRRGAAADLNYERARRGVIWGVTEKAARALMDAVKTDGDIEVRREAMIALVAFDDGDGLDAGSLLSESLTDDDDYIRIRAAVAIGRIRPPGAVTALGVALQDGSAIVRREAAYALGAYEEHAVEMRATLLKMLREDSDASVREACEAAIQSIDSAMRRTAPPTSAK